jgi:hypothetical protein
MTRSRQSGIYPTRSSRRSTSRPAPADKCRIRDVCAPLDARPAFVEVLIIGDATPIDVYARRGRAVRPNTHKGAAKRLAAVETLFALKCR